MLLFRVCLLNKPLGALVMVLLTRYRCSVSLSPPLISMQLLEVAFFFLFLCIRLVFRGFFLPERFCFLVLRREIRKFSCAWHPF